MRRRRRRSPSREPPPPLPITRRRCPFPTRRCRRSLPTTRRSRTLHVPPSFLSCKKLDGRPLDIVGALPPETAIGLSISHEQLLLILPLMDGIRPASGRSSSHPLPLHCQSHGAALSFSPQNIYKKRKLMGDMRPVCPNSPSFLNSHLHLHPLIVFQSGVF
jgi:hypothetical protein